MHEFLTSCRWRWADEVEQADQADQGEEAHAEELLKKEEEEEEEVVVVVVEVARPLYLDTMNMLSRLEAGWERFAEESLAENAANGDHVGGEEGKESKRNNDVEGEGGAEVDEAQDASDDGCKADGVVGDLTFVVHLSCM